MDRLGYEQLVKHRIDSRERVRRALSDLDEARGRMRGLLPALEPAVPECLNGHPQDLVQSTLQEAAGLVEQYGAAVKERDELETQLKAAVAEEAARRSKRILALIIVALVAGLIFFSQG